MRITDINTYCLEHIIRNLELEDLLSVADTNKCLRSVAQTVFKFKYGKMPVTIQKLTPGLFIEYEISTRYTSPEPGVEIRSLKAGLQILRCFGHFILTLRIWNFKKLDEQIQSWGRVFAYIGKYCAETMNDILFLNCYGTNMSHLKNPLLNVEKLSIYGSRLRKNWLSRMFPKLRDLKVSYKDLNLIGIESHFPNLKILQIDFWLPWNTEQYTQVLNVLSLNPQLQVLSIPFLPKAELFDFISQSMPNLEVLFFNKIRRDFQNYNGPSYHLENLRRFGINLLGMSWHYLDKIPIPFSFGSQLEELNIESFRAKWEQQLVEFAQKYRSIRKLTMMVKCNESDEEVLEYVPNVLQAFQAAREIGINFELFSQFRSVEKLVTEILKKCGTLKRYEKNNDNIGLKHWFYAE